MHPPLHDAEMWKQTITSVELTGSCMRDLVRISKENSKIDNKLCDKE